MEGQIQTQKYGFIEKISPKNIGILHIFYPKIRTECILLLLSSLGQKFDGKKLFDVSQKWDSKKMGVGAQLNPNKG